jgi:hypothetical protein
MYARRKGLSEHSLYQAAKDLRNRVFGSRRARSLAVLSGREEYVRLLEHYRFGRKSEQ